MKGYLVLDGAQKVEFNHIYFVAVHNHPYEGGGFRFAPGADPGDGRLNVCVIHSASRLQVLKLLISALFGMTKKKKNRIRCYTCQEVEIHMDQPMAGNCRIRLEHHDNRRKREEWNMRIGQGYDVHRLVEGRDLILGGVTVPYEKGLLGHSDADVLVHAVMDALLGAAALGDIGQHFPDTDPAYKGISSIKLLEAVGKLLEEKGYVIENIDATIIAQRPKLAAYRPQMAENIAHALNLPVNRVSVKATTEEGLGFTGTGEGISSQAITLLTSVEDYCYDDRMKPQGCSGCQGCAGQK